MKVELNEREVQMLMESIDLIILELKESQEAYTGSVLEMLKESEMGYLRLKEKLMRR